MMLCYFVVIFLLVVAYTDISYSEKQNRIVAKNGLESIGKKSSGINTATNKVAAYSGTKEGHMEYENKILAIQIYENSSSEGLDLNPPHTLFRISEATSNDIKAYTTATNMIMFIAQMIDVFLSRNIIKERNLASSILPEKREISNTKPHIRTVRNAQSGPTFNSHNEFNESQNDSTVQDIYNGAILTCLVREARKTEQKTNIGECILLLLCKISPFVSKIQESMIATYSKTENSKLSFIQKYVIPQINSYKQHDVFCQRSYFKCITDSWK